MLVYRLPGFFRQNTKPLAFDINKGRVEQLMTGVDNTLEVDESILKAAINNGFVCTTELEEIKDC